jgi:hypothetical protein
MKCDSVTESNEICIGKPSGYESGTKARCLLKNWMTINRFYDSPEITQCLVSENSHNFYIFLEVSFDYIHLHTENLLSCYCNFRHEISFPIYRWKILLKSHFISNATWFDTSLIDVCMRSKMAVGSRNVYH